jgi:predicted SAM-dependent methyltransferase
MTEEKTLKLDLACGHRKQVGFLGVDKIKVDDVDIIMDLEIYPWKWKDGEIDEIYCSHYIEHVTDLFKFMDECWRILKKGGKMTVISPYYNSVRAWMDPTHKRAISEFTFCYFNKEWRDREKLEHYDVYCDFDFTYGYAIEQMWMLRSEEARAFAMKHYTNVINDIIITLTKR